MTGADMTSQFKTSKREQPAFGGLCFVGGSLGLRDRIHDLAEFFFAFVAHFHRFFFAFSTF